MQIDTTIRIELDCSERLENLLRGIVTGFAPAVITPTPKVEPEAVAEPPAPKKKRKAKEVVKDEAETEQTASTEEPTAEVAEQTEEAAEHSGSASEKEITDVEVRAAIKECRERIVGDAGDPTIHAAVRDALKLQVQTYGVESSKNLNQEQRKAFIQFCKELTKDKLNINSAA